MSSVLLQVSRLLLALTVASAPLAALPVAVGPVQMGLTEVLLLLSVAIVGVWWLSQRADARSGPPPNGVGLVPVALFLVAALLSLLVTEYPRQSLRELRLLVVEPVALYLMLRLAPVESRWPRLTLDALIVVTGVVAAIGLGMWILGRSVVEAEGVQRALGLYPSPNHFALILGRVIPFSLALALVPGPGRPGYVAVTVALAVALVTTFSGGGWLGTFAAMLTVIWVLHGWRRSALLLVGGGILAGVVLAVARVERVRSRLDPSRGTGFLRVQLWESSIAMLRDHPILGTGLDNFLYLYQQRYMSPAAAEEPHLSHPHNWLLNFWLSLGLLGLISVLWLLGQFFWTARAVLRSTNEPVTRALTAGAVGSMVSFLVHGAVDNSYFLPDMAMVFWFTLALPSLVHPPSISTSRSVEGGAAPSTLC